MSNLQNAKLIGDLWEEFENAGGNIKKLCDDIDLSSGHLSEAQMIDILKERIEELK
jgi:hypothetical protein